MKQILLLGYGNPFRGDDGAGRRVAQLCAADWPPVVAGARLTIAQRRQLLPEDAELISGCDLVLFVDAAVGAPPGQVNLRPCAPGWRAAAPSTHHLTPDSLLGLAAQVYGRAPRAFLCTITAADFPHGETLSPAVAAAVPRAAALLADLLAAEAAA